MGNGDPLKKDNLTDLASFLASKTNPQGAEEVQAGLQEPNNFSQAPKDTNHPPFNVLQTQDLKENQVIGVDGETIDLGETSGLTLKK